MLYYPRIRTDQMSCEEILTKFTPHCGYIHIRQTVWWIYTQHILVPYGGYIHSTHTVWWIYAQQTYSIVDISSSHRPYGGYIHSTLMYNMVDISTPHKLYGGYIHSKHTEWWIYLQYTYNMVDISIAHVQYGGYVYSTHILHYFGYARSRIYNLKSE